MIKYLSLIYILVILSWGAIAQDAIFSQYYSSELYLNPALAGEERDLFFSSNYRQQWNSIVLPYTTSQLSIVSPIYTGDVDEKHIGGVGLSVYNDKAGASNFRTTGASATFAYNLPLAADNSQDVSFGLQVGIVQKTVDFTNLRWGEQYNPYIGFDVSKTPSEENLRSGTVYPDISVGAMYYFNPEHNYRYRKYTFFAGASAYHINQPDESFAEGIEAKLPVLLKLHGGMDYLISKRSSISPNFLIMHQHEKQMIDLGFYWNYRITDASYSNVLMKNLDVILGLWHRIEDAVIISTGIGNDAFTLGFSYDYNTSSLRRATNGQGAWEISLKVKRVKSHKRKRIATPRI